MAGDARGSHHMPLMPVSINTPVAEPYCLPLVACMAYSVTSEGKLSEGVDVFGNLVWDQTRLKAQRKAEELRQQGFVGPAMLPIQELEYSAFRHHWLSRNISSVYERVRKHKLSQACQEHPAV